MARGWHGDPLGHARAARKRRSRARKMKRTRKNIQKLNSMIRSASKLRKRSVSYW